MALTSGFFDSVDGDRRYDADQFSSFLDGIVYDGVYGAYGNCFYVRSNESEDLGIIIDTGRAWFNHTWTLNDTYYNLTMPEADLLLDRIDAVVIEVNKEDRQNSFQVVQGTPAESPVRPTLKGRSGEVTEEIYQYAIAYIARPAASTTITQDQIVYVVDTSETPLCSALALAGIPSGGKIGQVLAKKSSESAAVDWYDLDKLPYDKWYLTEGISENNVVAAYKFIGRVSEADALKPVNEKNNYILTKYNSNVKWASTSGFYISGAGGLNNTNLYNASNIETVILKYNTGNQTKLLMIFEAPSTVRLYLSYPKQGGTPYYEATSNIGAMDLRKSKNIIGPSRNSYYNGILGWSTGSSSYGSMYVNSQLYNTTGTITKTNGGLLVGCTKSYENTESGSQWYYGWFNIEYLAIYNMNFTAQQHNLIYKNITSDYANTIG